MHATVIVKKLIMVHGVQSRLTPQYSDTPDRYTSVVTVAVTYTLYERCSDCVEA